MSLIPFLPLGAARTFPDGDRGACIVPFPPNWSTPVDETLSWKIASVMTQIGSEQRRSLRREPRLRLEFTSLVHGADMALLQSILVGWSDKEFAVPMWYGKTRLAAPSNGTSLTLRGSPDTLFMIGGWALLWASSRVCEPVKIVDIIGSTLLLDAAPAQAWPADSVVTPLQFAQMQDTQSYAPTTAGVASVSWVFEQIPGHAPLLDTPSADVWPETFPEYSDANEPRNHFLAYRHNWAGAGQVTVASRADVFDPGVGLLSRRAAVDRAQPGWSLDVLLTTREATALLRKFLAVHEGPAVAFWAASPVADLRVAGDAPALRLPLHDDGQGALPNTLRQGVEITTANGPLRRGVLSTTKDWVDLVGADLQLFGADVRRARWASRCRLAVEDITISHQTNGVATVRLPVVAVDSTSGAGGGGSGGAGGGSGAGGWAGGGGQGSYGGVGGSGGSIVANTQFTLNEYFAPSEFDGYVFMNISQIQTVPVDVLVSFAYQNYVAEEEITIPRGFDLVPVKVPFSDQKPDGTLVTIKSTSKEDVFVGSLYQTKIYAPTYTWKTELLYHFNAFLPGSDFLVKDFSVNNRAASVSENHPSGFVSPGVTGNVGFHGYFGFVENGQVYPGPYTSLGSVPNDQGGFDKTDFCLEFYAYAGNYEQIASDGGFVGVGDALTVALVEINTFETVNGDEIWASKKLQVSLSMRKDNNTFHTGTLSYSADAGVYHHIAVFRVADTVYFTVGGDLVGMFNSSDRRLAGSLSCRISETQNAAQSLLIDELRVTKGFSRYTPEAYSPGAIPFVVD